MSNASSSRGISNEDCPTTHKNTNQISSTGVRVIGWPAPHILAAPSEDMSDLAKPVLGIELSEHAPTVKWNNRTKTVLPFISAENPLTNALPSDVRAVRRLARLAMTYTKFPFVVPLTPDDPKLAQRCRENLSVGNVVVVEQFQNPRQPQPSLTESYLRDHLRLDVLHHLYEAHDALKRQQVYDEPHMPMSLKDFLAGIRDHNAIRCILSIDSTTLTVPPLIQDLDDSYAPIISNLDDVFPPGPKISPDVVKLRTWNLLHGAGYHTHAHKDGDGLGTYVIIESGVKMWCIIRPGNDYLEARDYAALYQKTKVMTRFSAQTSKRAWEDTNPQVALLQLEPGDLLLMPPGTWHEVFTPIQGIASGGHFLSYDSLHLTAFSRKNPGTARIDYHLDYNPDGFRFFATVLNCLSDQVYIWPPVDDLLYSGNTIEQLYDIESAARQQHTAYYHFSLLSTHPVDMEDLPFDRLINRTYSPHPEILGEIQPSTLILQQDKEACSREWLEAEEWAVPQWYSLPDAAQRQQDEFGKICAYFSNGQFKYAIHCMGHDDHSFALVNSFVPLSEIRTRGATVNANQDQLPAAEATDYFLTWVGDTYQHLVHIDEYKRSHNTYRSSGLRIFCRIDVGVIELPTGQHQYAVLAIHRSHNTRLYAKVAPEQHVSLMLDLAATLIATVSDRQTSAAASTL